jgi:RNA polymerase sigma-70 factor (ECF subfamily)
MTPQALKEGRRLRGARLRRLADEDLIELVRAGDARALGVIFDRHGGPAFSLAYRMCGRRAAAEDIVQEAFVSLWRTRSRYDLARGSVRSWVLAVVRHRAIDSFRKESARKDHEVRDFGLAERLPSPARTEEEVESRDDAGRVRGALEELPAEQRRVIELAYFGGFTHTEIAAILGLPAGTVKGRMRLGLSRLRTALSGSGVGP